MLPKPLIEALAEVIWENEKTRALILEIAREGEKNGESPIDSHSKDTGLQINRREHGESSKFTKPSRSHRQVQQVGDDRR